jgi:amylosucrase
VTGLIEARKGLPSLHASVPTEAAVTADPSVLVFRRRHAAGSVVQVYNLSESTRVVWPGDLHPLAPGPLLEHISGQVLDFSMPVVLPPYAAWWLTAAD